MRIDPPHEPKEPSVVQRVRAWIAAHGDKPFTSNDAAEGTFIVRIRVRKCLHKMLQDGEVEIAGERKHPRGICLRAERIWRKTPRLKK